MNIPEHIFRTYDIRGIYPLELNEDLAYKIARAYVVFRQREAGKTKLKIAVGYDMRLSSPDLVAAVKRGLKEQGADVLDIGLASTPTYYFAVSRYECDGGFLVSASHNPKEYNGLKIVKNKAIPLGQGSGMEDLRELVKVGNFPTSDYIGKEESQGNALDEETVLCEKYADLEKIKPFKIVADTANAMGILYLERLFKDLPQIELIKMNEKLDGTFPAHQADPFQEANIKDLERRVLKEKANLGIATDGDGDRIFFVDNEGKRIKPEIMRGILAQTFLKDHPGATICYDIRPGRVTREMIEEAGGKPSVTRVGHSLIKKQMMEENAVFGGESSGHFFVQFAHGTYEAPMVVVLRFLQVLSESEKTSAEFIKPLDRYSHSGEVNFEVDDKAGMIKKLAEKYADGEISYLDGLTVTYSGYWFNVRASNTEPLLRLNLESKTKEMMEEKVKEISKIIEE